MKNKLKVKLFSSWHPEQEIVDFINKENINKEDILEIIFKSTGGVYALFYYDAIDSQIED